MNIDTLIQELGDLCHESYTGCNAVNAATGEYEYCYKNEVINLLNTTESKAIISKHLEKLIEEVGDRLQRDGNKSYSKKVTEQLGAKWLGKEQE